MGLFNHQSTGIYDYGNGIRELLCRIFPPDDPPLLKHKRPARLNIGNDLDPEVIRKAATTFKYYDTGSQNSSRAPYFIKGDAVRLLEKFQFRPFFSKNTFIYSDPPYLMETRKGGKLYNFEYTDDQHLELLTTLKAIPCMVMISGYWSEMYADMLSDWNSFTFKAMTRQGLANEWVWYNYPDPVELHDYSFLGSNFRERERIKRKIGRWTNRLKRLPVLERKAILEKIISVSDPTSTNLAISDRPENLNRKTGVAR